MSGPKIYKRGQKKQYNSIRSVTSHYAYSVFLLYYSFQTVSTREGFSCSLHFIMDNSNVGKKNILAWKTAFHREMICLNIIDRQPFSWH